MSKIVFNPDLHKYSFVDNPDIPFTSVSKVIELIKPKFDKEGISKRYAEKHGLTQEEVLASWDKKNADALAKGTKWHEEQERNHIAESNLIGYSLVETPEQEGAAHRMCLDISSLQPGKYCELIIPYVKEFLIGTADIVEINEDKTFFIKDWKTNNKLEFTGTAYYKPELKKKVVEKMLHPVEHLDNVNWNHYQIQLSLYSYFLESYGFKFAGGEIMHVLFDEEMNHTETKVYPIQYLKKEVINILKWYSVMHSIDF